MQSGEGENNILGMFWWKGQTFNCFPQLVLMSRDKNLHTQKHLHIRNKVYIHIHEELEYTYI